jgi:bHLH factor
MKYIKILSDILTNGGDSSGLMLDNEMDELNNNNSEITNEILSKELPPVVKPVSKQHIVNNSKASGKPNKTTKSIQSRRNVSNTKLNLKLNSKSNLGPCLISPRNEISTAADLGLILESDGESLQLSEPCLSPLDHHMKTAFNCSSTSNDSLELGLLLESDGESLHLSEPCLSPLSTLDSLNPFNDLLHTGFSDQTALELYL